MEFSTVQDGQSADLDGAAFPALGRTADGEPRAHGAAAAPAAWVSSWGGGGSTALKERLAQSEPKAAVSKHRANGAAGMLQHARSRPAHPDDSDGATVPWVDTGEQETHALHFVLNLHQKSRHHEQSNYAGRKWMRLHRSVVDAWCTASTGRSVSQQYAAARDEARDHARIRNAYFQQVGSCPCTGSSPTYACPVSCGVNTFVCAQLARVCMRVSMQSHEVSGRLEL
jgi:hypothetical protein